MGRRAFRPAVGECEPEARVGLSRLKLYDTRDYEVVPRPAHFSGNAGVHVRGHWYIADFEDGHRVNQWYRVRAM